MSLYTEYRLYPELLLFYSPTITISALAMRGYKLLDKPVKVWFLSILISIIGLSLLSGILAIYRHLGLLIPAIAISASLTYKNPRSQFLMLVLLALSASTLYPSPNFTYGRGVDYYPEEYEALKWLAELPQKPLLTDGKIRVLASYLTGFPWSWHDIPDLKKPPPFDSYVLITEDMVKYGAWREYEWWRPAEKVNLDPFLNSPYYELIYSRGGVWIFETTAEMK